VQSRTAILNQAPTPIFQRPSGAISCGHKFELFCAEADILALAQGYLFLTACSAISTNLNNLAWRRCVFDAVFFIVSIGGILFDFTYT
jgi:hypothetical protein